MRIQNISNNDAIINLFIRNEDGSQTVRTVRDFLPYYFNLDTNGKYKGYTGEKLSRINCNAPRDVKKQRTSNSWSADLIYIYRYLIDKVYRIDKSKTRILFLDIEIQAPELPRPRETKTAPYPISTIVTYDNYTKEYKTFFIRDYETEYEMLTEFCNYIYDTKPDIITSWNIDFDFYYLALRYPDFSRTTSPIKQTRWRIDIEAPAGISMVDMTGLDFKYTLGKRDSYKLDLVANEDLNFELWGEDTDFMNIDHSKEKCLKDVEKIVKLNEKNKYFELFDDIRRFSKCTWEDLPAERRGYSWQSLNSRPWDILFYQKAKDLEVVLPCKPNYSDEERHQFFNNVIYKKDGAYRETFHKGIFFDAVKLDLGSAYPRMIIDFNLDQANLKLHTDMPEWFPDEEIIEATINQGYDVWSQTEWGDYLVKENLIPIPVTYRETEEELRKRKEYKNNFPIDWKPLRGVYYFKQNPNTVMPLAYKAPMDWKQSLKTSLNSCLIDSPERPILKNSYKACKSFNNSGFGVSGNIYTRLFRIEIFNTITFLVRDLLHYIEKKLEKQGLNIIFIDTDSFVLDSDAKEIVSYLNRLIQEWAMDKYRNPNVNVQFEYEGTFRQLYVGSKCRYLGKLEHEDGEIEPERKGLQLVRRDSEKWVKNFQKNLINILFEKAKNDDVKKEIITWIRKQIKEMQKAPIKDIAIPTKLNKPRNEYKKKEIYFEAIDETRKLSPEFDKAIGEKFWWIYTNKPRVMAFDNKTQKYIKRQNIDWLQMMERNIFNILVPIFKGLGWETDLLNLAESYGIILDSTRRNDLLEDVENFEEKKDYYSARSAKKRIKQLLDK